MKTFWIIAFLLAIFFSPLGHDPTRYGIPPTLSWNDSSFLLGLFFLFWLTVSSVKNFSGKIFVQPHVVWLMGYFIVLLVSIIMAPAPRSLGDVFPLALPGLLALLFSSLYSRRRVVIFALGLLGILTLQAQWAVVQFALQHDLGLTLLGEPRLSPVTVEVAKFALGDTKVIRGYGPYLHANAMAGAMLAGLVLLSYMATAGRREWRVFFLPVYASLLLALLMSFSRIAYVGFAILTVCSLAIVFSHRVKNLRSLRPYGIILFGFGLALAGLLVSRLADPADQAMVERLRGLQWYSQLFTPQALRGGVGLGNYEQYLYSWLTAQHVSFAPWEVAPIHSAFLLSVIEVGILPLLGLAMFWALFVWRQWRPRMATVALVVLPAAPIILLDHYLVSLPSTLAVLLTVWLLILSMEPGMRVPLSK